MKRQLAAWVMHLISVSSLTAAPGDLDGSFDTDGRVSTAIGSGNDYMRGVAIQSDGRIVCCGHANTGAGDDFALVRYNADGSPDNSFGTGGMVTTAFAGSLDWARALAIQSDGKIVVCGHSGSGNSSDDFAVARYNTDGSLDDTFSTDGKVTVNMGGGDDALALAIQSDGRIVVVGSANTGGTSGIARFNTDGTLDNTFSGDGMLLAGFGQNEVFTSVAIQPDGKIVVAGYVLSSGGVPLVARYNTDGTLDTDFGTSGKTITSTGGDSPVYSLKLQPDGRILLGGSKTGDVMVMRYTSAGILDNTFNSTGYVTTDLGGTEGGAAIALQANGKILIAGNSNAGGTQDFAVARYDTDGTLDTTFNSTGKLLIPIGTGNDQGNCIAVQNDDYIVIGGFSHNGSNYDFALARVGAELHTGARLCLQSWRFANFGTTADSGSAADLADPDDDGLENLLEFAMGTSPLQPSPPSQRPQVTPNGDIFTYQRSYAAVVDGIIFTVRHSTSLNPDEWSSNGVTESLLSTDGSVQVIEATLPAAISMRRFAKVQVSH